METPLLYKSQLFVLLILLLALSSQAQDDDEVKPFGQEMLTWVQNDAAKESRSLCLSDYPNRVQKTLALSYDNMYRSVGQTDSLLQAIIEHIAKVEHQLQGKDSVIVAVERSADGRSSNFLLLDLEEKIRGLRATYKSLDSIRSEQYFVFYGLPHVGRENILESYTELGNSLSATFNTKYDDFFYVSYGTDGSADIKGSGSAGMGAIIGTAIGAKVCGPWCAVAGAVIGFFVGWFIDNSARERREEEIAKQKKLLNQALELLPSKLLDGEQMYALYKNCYDSTVTQFGTMHKQIDTLITSLEQNWVPLFRYNTERIGLSAVQLSAEKIAYLQKQYNVDSSLRKLFNANIQQKVVIDLGVVMARLKGNKYALLNADHFSSAIMRDFEDYSDELYFVKTILSNLAADDQMIPNRSFILNQQQFVDNEITMLPVYREQLKSKPLALEPPAGNFEFYSAALKSPSLGNARYRRDNNYGFSLCYWGGGYGSCSDGSNNYRERFNGAGDGPITNVYGGSPDGGVKSFNASATRQIAGMKNGLNERKSRLDKDYISMKGALAEQTEKIVPVYEQKQVNLQQRTNHANSISTAFNDGHKDELKIYHDKLDEFSSLSFSSLSGQKLLGDLKLQQAVYNQIPAEHASSEDIVVGGTKYSSYQWTNKDQSNKEWARQQLKNEKAIKEIDERVSANFSQRKPDPVFKDATDYSNYKGRVDATRQFVNALSEEVRTRPISNTTLGKLTEHYTQQSQNGRLYGEGNFPTGENAFTNYNFLPTSQKSRLQKIIDEYRQCAGRDCQMIFNKAVLELTGDDWLLANKAGGPPITDQVSLFRTVAGSPDWSYIGNAATEQALNQAYTMASLGYSVIAFRPDGSKTEAAVLLPGLPYAGGKDKWLGINEGSVITMPTANHAGAGIDRPLSDLSDDPTTITIYTKPPVVHYNNLDISSFSTTGITTAGRYDLDLGTVTSPSIELSAMYKRLPGQSSTLPCKIVLSEDYVNRIKEDFGNHSGMVFNEIFQNRSSLFSGPVVQLPADLTNQQRTFLSSIEAVVSKIDGNCRLATNPEDLYYCQAAHYLYNTCQQQLAATALDAERTEILASSQQMTDALSTIMLTGLNLGTALTPGINDARDWYELVTGMDMITGEKLLTWERVATGIAVIAGSGVLYRNIVNAVAETGGKAVVKEAINGLPGLKYISDGPFRRSFKSEEGLIYRNWEILADGTKTESSVKHLLRRHTNIERLRTAENATKFALQDDREVFKIVDEAYHQIKQGKYTATGAARNGGVFYDVYLRPGISTDPARSSIKVILQREGEIDWLVTAYPIKTKVPKL